MHTVLQLSLNVENISLWNRCVLCGSRDPPTILHRDGLDAAAAVQACAGWSQWHLCRTGAPGSQSRPVGLSTPVGPLCSLLPAANPSLQKKKNKSRELTIGVKGRRPWVNAVWPGPTTSIHRLRRGGHDASRQCSFVLNNSIQLKQ